MTTRLRTCAATTLLLCSSACGGLLVIEENRCFDVVCPDKFVCEAGECVPAVPPCGPSAPDGFCPPNEICRGGVCFDPGTLPPACGEAPNGWCPGTQACVDGVCQDITVDERCSPDNPDGLCPGGQLCIAGYCYDQPAPCAPGNLNGYCPDGQACAGGACVPISPTCGPSQPDGTCPAWYTCVEGECVGPVPPDACSPNQPFGRCPAGEVCVGGTCTPLVEENGCSPERPNGLCPAGAACVDGSCDNIAPDEACSTSNPGGLCWGGATCVNGDCEHQPCGSGGWLCAPDAWCSDGVCLPLPCDPVHPFGECIDPTLACTEGVCLEPACAPDVPDGRCPAGLECRDGSCQAPSCSPSYPFGWCADDGTCCEGVVCCQAGDVCQPGGTCIEGPCSPTNLDGTCAEPVYTFHPTEGWNTLAAQCCDAALSGALGCIVGTCSGPPCSIAEPHGLCVNSSSEYCDAGTCVPAPCGPAFLNGTCDAGETCWLGVCRRPGCRGEPDPDAFCAPDVCDLVNNVCVQPACSVEHPSGFCPIGQICVTGTCSVPACAPEYPGGTCPPGQLCAGGSCIDPPCSVTFPTGACGANFECVLGQCELSDCSPAAPLGRCPSGERCISGSCEVYQCSTVFPGGPCPIGEICDVDHCIVPACSSEYPGGDCVPVNEICAGGTCVVAPCSSLYPTGACATGYFCALPGICTAAACGPTALNGVCIGADAGKVCVAGVCEVYECGSNFPSGPCAVPGQLCISEVCQYPACSPAFPAGVCAAPDVCATGACVTPACSAAVPDGACPTGQTCCDAALSGSRGCTVGTCVLLSCADYPGNGWCPSGQRCIGTTCAPYVCSATFPSGPCAAPNELCIANTCQVPACSPTYPFGTCPAPQLCSSGACVTPACSPGVPDGACPTGQQCCDADLVVSDGCTLGTCVLLPCAAYANNGYCPSGERCIGTTCVPYVCSVTFPSGPCPAPNEVCITNTCQVPTCQPAYPTGTCPAPQVCSGGACVTPACSPAVPTGECPTGQVCCDTTLVGSRGCTLGTCILELCADYADSGYCPPGERCVGTTCETYECSLIFPTGPCADPSEICNAGTCELPACSPTYPSGTCPAPQICSGGVCVTPACSPAVPTGLCPVNQVCCNATVEAAGLCVNQPAPAGQAGQCVREECSPTNQNGQCIGVNDGLVCCNDALVAAGACTASGPDQRGTCVSVGCGCAADEVCFTSNCDATCGSPCAGNCCAICDADTPDGWCPTTFACVSGNCMFTCPDDFDCDAISDLDEGFLTNADADGDGSPNYKDKDSDNDDIPDAVEAGDIEILTPPADFGADGDTLPDFLDPDSDGDFIADGVEAGLVPEAPMDSDGDGDPNHLDLDSDDDGILDRCEASDNGGLCANTTLITNASNLLDSECSTTVEATCVQLAGCQWTGAACALVIEDSTPDTLDLDSDNDGVSDTIEGRLAPRLAGTNPNGIDRGVPDTDLVPDYRDLDSDGDGVLDQDEDINGDGFVNCQVNGAGAPVIDTRTDPTCLDYDYNPGCDTGTSARDCSVMGFVDCDGGLGCIWDEGAGECAPLGEKCIMVETSRAHPDTDLDGIGDGEDGTFYVCSAENLKPINLFYSRPADYALALETSFQTTRVLTLGTDEVGLAFDDTDALTNQGSYAVSGFLLKRAPAASVAALAGTLIEKAIAQEVLDRAAIDTAVGGIALVINRNFTSFDGYGVLLSRYRITNASIANAELRDTIAGALGGALGGLTATGGPVSDAFILVTETQVRSNNTVMVVGALVPETTPAAQSYNYRPSCNAPFCSTTNLTIEAESSSARASASGDTWTDLPAAGGSSGPYIQSLPDNGTNCDGTNYATCGARISYTLNITVPGTYSIAFRARGPNNNGNGFYRSINGAAGVRVATSGNNTWGTVGTFSLYLPAGPSTLDVYSDEDGVMLDYVTVSYVGCLTACPANCDSTGPTSCAPDPDYQIPLFFADNITNGSALAQFGDDVETLCQSLIQRHGKLDITWVVDNSGSMGEEIDQVQQSATLFFGLMNNSEADYRIGQATSAENRTPWEPEYAFTDPAGDETNRRNGMLVGDFTGAVAGIVDAAATDRTVGYSCASGCFNGQPCCPQCPVAVTTNDPSCYFASRLPNTSGSGDEFSLMMAQWAVYRAGAGERCTALTDSAVCAATSGCAWQAGQCIPATCVLPAGSDNAEQCNGNDPTQVPAGADTAEDELEPAGCEWNPQANACWPSVGVPCGANTDAGTCAAQAPRCSWTGTACVPNITYGAVLCSAFDNQTTCEAQGNTWCEWDANLWGTGTAGCRPPLKKALRPDAYKFVVVLTDEEECFLKDIDFNGDCEEYYEGYYAADDPLRLARQDAYLNYFLSRDVTVFGIIGDKTTGCATAEPVDGVANVAEGSGGGWGSICAADLYPTIEAVVIGALGKASPYKLEGFIAGAAVQPISSTIKVAVEVCDVPSEYPDCASGTHQEVVPRSRADGFDYDAINNTLILYGSARPAAGGDIVVSYRYWVDNPEPPDGDPDCPCPETDPLTSCDCGPGRECGIDFPVEDDHCALTSDDLIPSEREASCALTPGCIWNTADGGTCVTTGICEPDPTCGCVCGGGVCGPRTDPSRICDPEIGLCVCDTTCSNLCGAGQTCDRNLASATCGQCRCDTTCGGRCPTDVTSDGKVCDNGSVCAGYVDLASCEADLVFRCDWNGVACVAPHCGECTCDTTCGGLCPPAECDQDPASPTCGFCQSTVFQDCSGGGQVYDPGSGECICDTTCGGGCVAVGRVCDDNSGGCAAYSGAGQATCELNGCVWQAPTTTCISPTCGFCVCDPTCGDPDGPGPLLPCPTGSACDSALGSPSCGLCVAVPECADSADCNPLCATAGTPAACASIPDCFWPPWANGGSGGCFPLHCERCSGQSCVPDPYCCDALGSVAVFELATGECVCDDTCGGVCPAGTTCDGNQASATCGQCVCDPTCGDPDGPGPLLPCPAGSSCDSVPSSTTCGLCVAVIECAVNADCDPGCAAAATELACSALPDCVWPPWANGGAGGCFPLHCELCSVGSCVADPTCCDDLGWVALFDPGTGECVCDDTCGGVCPAGTTCDGNQASPTCGQCVCDPTCGDPDGPGPLLPCPTGSACDSEPTSDTCGLCVATPECAVSGDCNPPCATAATPAACALVPGCFWPPWANGGAGGCFAQQCELCSVGFCVADPFCCDSLGPVAVFDPGTGACVCDDTCGGVCPAGTICDDDQGSASCGQCVCETDCGFARTGVACPTGSSCDSVPGSPTCGLCIAEPECAVDDDCNPSCEAATSAAECALVAGCFWPPWANDGAGGCFPLECKLCTVGLCLADPFCCVELGTVAVFNPANGQCECDPSCGGACLPGTTCDDSPSSPTCGQCLCDTSCGDDACMTNNTLATCTAAGCDWSTSTGECHAICPPGQACDDNSGCAPATDEGACLARDGCSWNAARGECLSIFCGQCVVRCGDCPPGTVCNPTTGLCEPQCPDCPPGTVCDPLTGQCVCDQTCGGVCPLGRLCDGDLESPTCGQCLCDTTCGGSCPTCQVCDDDPASGTCGLCIAEPDCGGPCGSGEICDPITGCCIADPNCGGCPPDWICNPTTGRCEPYDPGG